MKTKKAIVFFSAGLGDALLFVPVIKRLKAQGYFVSGFFNSKLPCREMMENTGLLNEVIDAKNKARQALVFLQKIKSYDLALLNPFACSRSNFLTARAIASQIVTNCETKENNSKIKFVVPVAGIHDAEQNLRLIGERNFTLFDLRIQPLDRPQFSLPKNYIALQVSSGNPNIAYKNWPFENWMEFLALLLSNYPDKKLVLLGNKYDLPLAEKLEKEFGSKIISLAAQTSVTQAMQVLSHCQLFIGSDGGLMHLAAAFGKPTFTLWGPSSEKLYGYEQFDNKMHKCIRAALSCHPCNAWVAPNTSKTNAPEDCPDHACMKELGSKEVFAHFTKYVNSLPQDVW